MKTRENFLIEPSIEDRNVFMDSWQFVLKWQSLLQSLRTCVINVLVVIWLPTESPANNSFNHKYFNNFLKWSLVNNKKSGSNLIPYSPSILGKIVSYYIRTQMKKDIWGSFPQISRRNQNTMIWFYEREYSLSKRPAYIDSAVSAS